MTYSPGCSLIADMPADQPVTVDIARPVEREDAFEITVAIRQRGPGESQIAAAAFLMSGYEVWPESAGPVEVKRLAPEDTWTFATALKKPPQALEGEHWFVVVGLIDGVPFTRTRRVLMEAARARDPMR